MSVVLYRKYRPKSFSEVEGQGHVTKTLRNAVIYNKIAHAYIFIGPRGTGKTTIARILAKAVNCLEVKNGEPCNKCRSCEAINQGRALDLVEIDAASNRGIDDIRALKENIGFSPSSLKFKVFIIDEVHMLTKEAFNALLKTLEEPPEHAIFILATTEVYKVPETIISRCQRFDFRKLSLAEIKKRLLEIVKEEGVTMEEGAAELIALNAGGALRDAESILGLIMSMEDKNITAKEAQTVLGTPEISSVAAFVKLIGQRKATEAISYINELNANGYDLEQFNRALVEYLRNALLLKVNIKLKKLVEAKLTGEQADEMIEIGKALKEEEMLKILKIFIGVQNDLKSSMIIQLPLEMAVIEILGDYDSGKIAPEKTEKTAIIAAKPLAGENKKTALAENKEIVFKKIAERVPEKKAETEIFEQKEKITVKKEEESGGLAGRGKDEILNKWPEILKELKNYNHFISAYLKSCSFIDVRANEIIVSTPYVSYKEKLEESKIRGIINDVLDKIIGRTNGKMRLKIVFDKDLEKMGYKLPEKKKTAENAEAAVLDILGGEVVK